MPSTDAIRGQAIQSEREIFVRSNLGFPSRGSDNQRGHELVWGFNISHCDLGGNRRLVQFSGWALSQKEKPSAIRNIIFRSMKKTVYVATANTLRPDVLRALSIAAAPGDPVAICGFKDRFKIQDSKLEVVIETGDGVVAVGDVTFQPAGVLAGTDGWLFLAGDSNDSVAQHCTDFQPDEDWIFGWANYFAAIPRISSKKIAFLVAPAKETVMPDRYPSRSRARTALDHLQADHPGRIVFPLEQLRACRDLAFDRTDTHWTDLGARITCDAALAHIDETVPIIPSLYEIGPARGDLGDKLVPAERGIRASAAWPNQARMVFDNLILHHGNLRVFVNPNAPINKTVAIFGGSSSEAMIRYLGALYSRVVSLYSAGSWDPTIIEQERPDIVILQTNERFLVKPPLAEFDSLATAQRKVWGQQTTSTGEYPIDLSRYEHMEEDWHFARHFGLVTAEE